MRERMVKYLYANFIIQKRSELGMRRYLLYGILIGAILFMGIQISVMFHDPQEAISYYQGQLDGKRAYWFQPSLGGQPHIRCVDFAYMGGETFRCDTESVWRFDTIGISLDVEKIGEARAQDQYNYLASLIKENYDGNKTVELCKEVLENAV